MGSLGALRVEGHLVGLTDGTVGPCTKGRSSRARGHSGGPGESDGMDPGGFRSLGVGDTLVSVRGLGDPAGSGDHLVWGNPAGSGVL